MKTAIWLLGLLYAIAAAGLFILGKAKGDPAIAEAGATGVRWGLLIAGVWLIADQQPPAEKKAGELPPPNSQRFR